MPRPSRTCTSLCSLAVALVLVVLATIINAKDSHHLLSHHRQQRPPQQQQQQQQQDHIRHDQHHHRHGSILTGALFPVANNNLAGKEEYVKEPCPTGCVHHHSDIYLAVTSIGEGSPRIQFTCSHAHPSQPTATARYPEGNHHHYLQHHAHHGQDIDNQEPADPIPEQIPHAPSHRSSKCNHHDRIDGGASVYTDLHITADLHLRGSNPIVNNHNPIAAGGFHPHYDLNFSPRESRSADFSDDTESHTTTMTFSDDNNDRIEHIASAERRLIPLTAATDDDQDPHHQQAHILPVHDHNNDRHLHHGAAVTAVAGGSGATTPEAIVTLAAPTSSPHPESGSDRGQRVDYRAVSKAAALLRGQEFKAGPAAPTPEAFPGQTKGHTQTHDHHHHKQGDVSVGGKEKVTGQSPVVRYRTIVHRVTTLIIETETVVNRPTPTPTATAAVGFMQGLKERSGRAQQVYHHHNNMNMNKKKDVQHDRDPYGYGPHAGDHIMFDAGVDGEMVVSIASSEQSSRRHKKE